MKHGTMGFATALEAMASDHTLETAALGQSGHIDDIADLEKVTDDDLLAKLETQTARWQRKPYFKAGLHNRRIALLDFLLYPEWMSSSVNESCVFQKILT